MGTKVHWAIAMAMLLAGCQSSADNIPDANKTPNEPTLAVSYPVINDFEIPGHATAETPISASGTRVRAGKGRVGILAIERPDIPPACIVAAQLRTYVIDSSGSVSELGLYPSLIFDAADKKDAAPFGYAETLLDIRPRAMMTRSSSSPWAAWDTTDIVTLWLKGGPFPSRGRRVPRNGPVVLALHDVEKQAPFGRLTIASSESSSREPHLVITHKRECPRT